jgi:hypothetical protein
MGRRSGAATPAEQYGDAGPADEGAAAAAWCGRLTDLRGQADGCLMMLAEFDGLKGRASRAGFQPLTSPPSPSDLLIVPFRAGSAAWE